MMQDLAYQQGFERAVRLRTFLANGGDPMRLRVWEVMLDGNEAVVMDVPLTYRRWYGMDAQYRHSSVGALGKPAFVAGALIGNAIGNAARRRHAVAASQPMWREAQTARVLVTDRRILCQTNRGWLSFWHQGVSASYPDPLAATLVLEFHDTSPLQLQGPDGAGLCVFATALLHGRHALYDHPAMAGLAPLSGPATGPA